MPFYTRGHSLRNFVKRNCIKSSAIKLKVISFYTHLDAKFLRMTYNKNFQAATAYGKSFLFKQRTIFKSLYNWNQFYRLAVFPFSPCKYCHPTSLKYLCPALFLPLPLGPSCSFLPFLFLSILPVFPGPLKTFCEPLSESSLLCSWARIKLALTCTFTELHLYVLPLSIY